MTSFSLGLMLALTQGINPPTSQPTKVEMMKPQLAQAAMEEFADCTVRVKTRRDAATKLLKTFPQDRAYTRGLSALTNAECVPRNVGTMSFQPDIMRLALFASLYRHNFSKQPIDSAQGTKPLNIRSEFEHGRGEINKIYATLREVADCVVRAKPREVHDLVVAKAFSAEESRMWPPLIAELGKCNRSDIEFKMQKVTLRGTLAEALYKVRTIYAPVVKTTGAPDA